MNNPIIDQVKLPEFDKIDSKHFVPAIKKIIEDNLKIIKNIEDLDKTKINYDFVNVLSKSEFLLSNAWSQIGHINSVINSESIRSEYNKCKDLITTFFSNLSQNEKIFDLYVYLKNSKEFQDLNFTQQKIINNEIRDFKLGGVGLDEEKKENYKNIISELSKLSSKFEENVLDETNDYFLHIKNKSDTDGIPDDILKMASKLASDDNQKGYYFTLHFPSYIPVLQYSKNRKLRQALYTAYAKKASEFSKDDRDNSSIIKKILIFRKQVADLLDFNSFAEMSLETKMADSPEEVCIFLRDLAQKAKPFAQADINDLKDIAKEDGLQELEAWDVAYYSEILKQKKYQISDNEVKKYFPEDKVIEGLFSLVSNLYGIKIQNKIVATWHDSVKYYELFQNDKLIGSFYLDLYARKNKRGGAWMDECVSKNNFNSNIDYPVAFLTCNFSSPIENNPALFTHDEVITLFHEFGHGLHHLLTKITDFKVSGIKGVEWDAVELPSQFMENFCWNWEVISSMSQHMTTKESMPPELFEKLIKSRNFQSGMQTLRQVEFALFDMLIHMDKNPSEIDVLNILEKVRDEVAQVRPPKWNRFPHSFSHIFAGGYSAGYYSYKWAEVLSADVFDEFLNNGVINSNIGNKFRNEILEVGGSRSAKESFLKFKGRQPSVDALLKHSGLSV
jgi:oligopeptidase A